MKKINKIEKLILEMCPNGVSYVKLGEVCSFNRGKSLSSEDAVDGNVPVVGGGKKPAFYHNVSNRDRNSITVSGSGANSGYVHYWDVPIFATDCFTIDIKDENKLNKKFLFYFLKNIQDLIYNKKRGAGVPHVYGKDLISINIPIPPMEIQKEVVKILDMLAELIVELTAECTIRKKQYEYYSTKLFNFDKSVKFVNLSEVAEVTDYVANGSFASLKENVSYKNERDFAVLIRTVDYSSNFDFNKMIYIDEHAYNFLAKSKLFGGEIIINNVGTVGATFRCPNLNIPMSLAPNAVMVKTKNDEFYYYWFKSKAGQEAIKKIVGQGAVPKFNKTGLRSIKVPVPSIEQQERIVNILSTFDKICNNISEGLPAEIALREKEFKYYQKKLLTFPNTEEMSAWINSLKNDKEEETNE